MIDRGKTECTWLNKRMPAIILGALCLVALIMLLVFIYASPRVRMIDNVPVDCNLGWTYQWEGSSEAPKLLDELPQYIPGGKTGDTVILRRTLREMPFHMSVLNLRTIHQGITVFVDGKQVYSSDYLMKKLPSHTPGNAWHFVRMPAGSEPKDVEIRLTGMTNMTTGLVRSIRVGSTSACIAWIVREHMSEFLQSLFVLFCGAVLLFCYVLLPSGKQNKLYLLYLGAFGVVASLWCFVETTLLQFLLEKPYFEYCLAHLCVFLLPVLLLQFMKNIYNTRFAVWYDRLSMIYLLYMLLASILHFGGVLDFKENTLLFNCINGAGIVFVLLESLREIAENGKKTIVFSTGAVLFCFGTIMDTYRSMNPITTDYSQYMRLFLTIFMVAIAIQALSGYAKSYRELVRNETLEFLAYHDPMTMLKNRTSFDLEILRLNQKSAERDDTGLIVFDINNLKPVNDQFGHAAGDDLLIRFADQLDEVFEKVAQVFRIGGDEFAVVYTGIQKGVIEQRLQRLRTRIIESNKVAKHKITLAYGHDRFCPQTDRYIEDLFKRVDKIMYANKILGKIEIEHPDEEAAKKPPTEAGAN